MSVIQIRKAQREGARLIIGLGGVSGCGKTYTAIQLAYGLANYQAGKVGFLDTENKRGSLYSDILPAGAEPFLIGDLYAPFTPQRYIDAIMEFQKAGVEVLVIDSASHEWEGTGGCIDIAEAGNPKMPNWQKAKKEHKRFMNAVLQSDMHIIFCVRAREKDKPEKIDGKTEYVHMGLQPIQEKNFMFEMTASLMLEDQGARQVVTKCPAALQAFLGRGEGYITPADGKAVRDWVDGGKSIDPKLEKWKNSLISNTEKGEAHILECWSKVPQQVQSVLGEGFKAQIVASAKEYDALRQAEGDAQPSSVGAGIAAIVGSTPMKDAPAQNQAPPPPPPAPQPSPPPPAPPAPPPPATGNPLF